MTTTEKRVNVVPSSDNGHFAVGAKKVINLDNVNETSFIEGGSKLETANHTTLENRSSCLITIQRVVNPLTGLYEKVKD